MATTKQAAGQVAHGRHCDGAANRRFGGTRSDAGGGSATRKTAANIRVEFENDLPLQRALFRYNHWLMAQISQSAACNRFHAAGQRAGIDPAR